MKVWKVRKYRRPPYTELRITCPNCGKKTTVASEWADPLYTMGAKGGLVMTFGRPCTYCCKTSALPPNAPGGKQRDD